ncbi:MAG: Uma2 family endonuclease [Caldilineaceae bacterium SB0670_bin_27]|uniref:Uma2 family endonuclease n=1 Tax=Caldilineaceae bacterium SB0664_bin_27 TaxID=2605260 RepID=A0A6B0YYZ4_9CHLR|nr:Uma2 family endonuclease [Caldilineaceae bacterium SB0664_bin_27]MYJ77173.1 Uma2 family endonuclease [Caldilineaceae bacterium SB0670_bin_27]
MSAVAAPDTGARIGGKKLEAFLPVTLAEGMPLRRFTLDEYHNLIEIGFFNESERVELVEGILVDMSPNNPPHIRTVNRLRRTFSSLDARVDIEVRAQGPVTIPELMTEPEPDLVISTETGFELDERHPYPSEILLLMEVSDSSLNYDRSLKRAIYAQAGIAEYWIWNLVDGLLEVYRDPRTPVSGEAAFQTKLTFHRGESVAPLAFPDLEVAVDDILPPAARTA